jgi:O-antigen/teichoic acid export membrane protein
MRNNSVTETLEQSTNCGLNEPLSKRVVRGGVWVFALRITARGLRFIRTVILARLLAPNDFGLFGIAMLSIATLEVLTQTGFEAALVQKKEHVESYLDTAWTISAIRGTILFSILFFLAPWIAKFFDSPQATMIIRVISISALLSGFKNVGLIFFQKELEFDKQFFYEFSSNLVDLAVAITLAFILRNVWALVWAGLAAGVVRLFMSYLIHPYRPHVSLAKKEFQELFGYGKWLLGSGMLVFLVTQGDDLFVGKALGPAALGLYQMAYLISNLPATEISRTMAQVAFPAYSKLQDNIPKLSDAYLKALHLTAFLSIPLAAGIFVLAPDFTKIFLGEKWMPMVPVIKVLVFAGLIRSIAATTGPILYGIGQPKIDTIWQTARLILLIALIYPLTARWGILGTSVAVLCSISVSTVGFSLGVIRITNCGIYNFGKALILPVLNSLIMAVLIIILKSNLQLTGFFPLLLLIGVGILTYFLITKIYDKFFDYEIGEFVRKTIILRQ